MNDLRNLNVAVYVTGSIACYKTLTLVRTLRKRKANVKVVMSFSARQFIQPLTFQVLSGNPVIDDHSFTLKSRGITHVDLARWTDVAIVMPATANLIAKVANGLADGVVSTCLLATSVPKILVPAMNNLMFMNPATQRNLRLLASYRHYYQWGPVYGRLAEGYSGKGRMMEPQDVIDRLIRWLNRDRPLNNVKLIVTAGGTQEPIDPVRFITNGSSGKMGVAIARAARQMGAQVTLICGHVDVTVPDGIKLVRVKTTQEMAQAVISRFPKVDGLIMAAALADFAPVNVASQKIKKTKDVRTNSLTLHLTRTPDVLRRIARIKRPGQFTVGFAAETQHLMENASSKLKAKGLDLIVANDVSDPKIGFGTDDNQVTFIDSKGHHLKTPVKPKIVIAKRLLQLVLKLKDDRS